jgi:hypothetical protein
VVCKKAIMPLRLSAEGAQVFDEWRKHRCRSPEDERLVAEVLRAIADRSWQVRWRSYKDESEPEVISIQPRDGLYLHVRLWAGEEEFMLVSITDIDVPDQE